MYLHCGSRKVCQAPRSCIVLGLALAHAYACARYTWHMYERESSMPVHRKDTLHVTYRPMPLQTHLLHVLNPHNAYPGGTAVCQLGVGKGHA